MLKITRQLSPVRRARFFLFLYWLHFCEAVELVPPGAPFPARLIRLTIALTAVYFAGLSLMQKDPSAGLAIILAYSGLMAGYAVVSALRLRLSRQRVHWVGE